MAEQRYPEPTVGGLVVNRKGEVLLLKSHKWGGRYVLPGGHIELGETMEQALVREIKEETGLDIHDPEHLLTQEYVYGENFWKKRHFIFFDYVCQTDATQVTLNHEAEEYVWVLPEESLGFWLEDYTELVIREYLKREATKTAN